MADDDVELPDLEVIARYSLAVRGATAPREEVIAALEADLRWLSSGRPRRSTRTAPRPATEAGSKAGSKAAAPRRRRTPRAAAE